MPKVKNEKKSRIHTEVAKQGTHLRLFLHALLLFSDFSVFYEM